MNKRLINEVTLTGILGNDKVLLKTIAALEYSCYQVPFKNVRILGPTPFSHPFIKWVEIPPHTYKEYSVFCLRELWRYIETPFCLLSQYDGFIIRGGAFEEEFLNYDFVGPPWPESWYEVTTKSDTRVGNGGFSLRSQKYLNATRNIPLYGDDAEDILANRIHKNLMLEQDVKFAPPDVAARFAIENSCIPEVSPDQNHNKKETIKSFGFHASWNDCCNYIKDWKIHPEFKLL